MQSGKICCFNEQKCDNGSRGNSKMSTRMYLTAWHYIPDCTYVLVGSHKVCSNISYNIQHS